LTEIFASCAKHLDPFQPETNMGMEMVWNGFVGSGLQDSDVILVGGGLSFMMKCVRVLRGSQFYPKII